MQNDSEHACATYDFREAQAVETAVSCLLLMQQGSLSILAAVVVTSCSLSLLHFRQQTFYCLTVDTDSRTFMETHMPACAWTH